MKFSIFHAASPEASPTANGCRRETRNERVEMRWIGCQSTAQLSTNEAVVRQRSDQLLSVAQQPHPASSHALFRSRSRFVKIRAIRCCKKRVYRYLSHHLIVLVLVLVLVIDNLRMIFSTPIPIPIAIPGQRRHQFHSSWSQPPGRPIFNTANRITGPSNPGIAGNTPRFKLTANAASAEAQSPQNAHFFQ